MESRMDLNALKNNKIAKIPIAIPTSKKK
jgi:hypothetical protein